MAETLEFNPNNLSILDTEIVGDYEAAEAFLSGTPIEEKKPPVEEKKETEVKVEEEKKETEEKEILDEELKEDEKDKEEESQDGFDYGAFAKDLLNIGVFTELEDEPEIKSPEDLLARMNYEKQMGATTWLEGFLSKFGDDRKDMFEAIFINGVDPKEYLPTFNKVTDFEALDITQEDAQKSVFREFYRRVGLDESDVEKKLQKSIDYGDLESDAKQFHPKLVDQDKKKLKDLELAGKEKEESQKRADLEYKNSVQKALAKALTDKEIKGIPITQQQANEVFDFIYTPKYKTQDGKLLTEYDKFVLESKKPENIEERIVVGLLKLGKFDFSKIEKNGVSKESKNLFSELAQKAVKSKTREITKTPAATTNSWSKL